MAPRGLGAPARGQTGVDFLVGVGVFLLTVGFVVAFAPEMFAPFTGGQAVPLVADRAADTVVGDLLAGGGPSTLDEACTLAFFGVTGSDDSGCRFSTAETSGDGLADELGVTAADSPRYNTQYRVSVSLERNDGGAGGPTVLCGSAGASPSVGECDATYTEPLTVGPSVTTTTESVVVASRLVAVGDRDALLVVRVW